MAQLLQNIKSSIESTASHNRYNYSLRGADTFSVTGDKSAFQGDKSAFQGDKSAFQGDKSAFQGDNNMLVVAIKYEMVRLVNSDVFNIVRANVRVDYYESQNVQYAHEDNLTTCLSIDDFVNTINERYIRHYIGRF